MDCHEALMARRRKKTAKTKAQKSANTDKILPAIPPPEARLTAYIPPLSESSLPDQFESTIPGLPSVSTTLSEPRHDTEPDNGRPAASSQNQVQGGLNLLHEHSVVTNRGLGGLTLPSTTYRDNRHSYVSQRSELSGGPEEFLIPLAFDPNPPKQQSPRLSSQQSTPQPRPADEKRKEYFNRDGTIVATGSRSQGASPLIAPLDQARQPVELPSELPALRRPSDVPSRSTSRTTSPHVQPELRNPSVQLSPPPRNDSARNDRFKLQEAPRHKRQLSGRVTPQPDSTPNFGLQASPDIKEQEVVLDQGRITPRLSYDTSPAFTDGFNSPQQISNAARALQDLPKRGDSLESAKKTIPRKELNTPPASTQPPLKDLSNAIPTPRPPPLPPATDSAKANGGKVISAPISSPGSQSIYDTPNLLQGESTTSVDEKFVQPRAPPAPPSGHARNGSLNALQSEAQKSPKLPRYSAGGDFTLEEDISRILGFDEPTANESFLRRVSNSVRHGRSYSDKSGRFSRERWPRSPVVTAGGHEISSPITSSPEHREELAWFKNELRRERQKNLEREKKISELEAQINATTDISQVNVELKEKRSTIVVLDTQKEVVVRELEVLTEHIANTKQNGEPLDMSQMQTAVLRDLAEALEKLKQSFTPQIETLVQQRNDLLEEVATLNQNKDKSFQEFEQLSNKNAQLAEFNNQLVDQIQNIYKTNRGPGMEDLKPDGLGIYSHQKDKSQLFVEGRDVRLPMSAQAPIFDPVATYETGEAGAIHSVGGAEVVEMKKGAVAKRFDWRKGQKMAKGLTKGVKGAFASAQQNYGRDMQFAETGAYGGPPQLGQEYGNTPRYDNNEPYKQGWFGSGTNARPPPGKNGLYANSANTSTPSLLANVPPTSLALFGTELEARVDFEKTNIPGIVKRCIAEVEARGMDVEGIYRKSGGNSQVQQVKEGFERQPSDYDISDTDLDIHAITSGLKQYFRKLPTPLITYDVYDTLIELTKIPEGPNQKQERIDGLREALQELPKVHYEILEYLMAHLAKVVVLEKENLMTPMNVAVVFAPTIMRPESVARELSDTRAKNEVVMWLVQDGEAVFRKS